jgi:protoheme IX farnesyltransferase
MNTPAIPLSRLRLTSRSGSVERLPHFISLAKPRVMALALFTAFVGLMIAPIRFEPLPAFIAILAIAAGAGAAGAPNMWYDADIDAVMARTAMRPMKTGTNGHGVARHLRG